MVRAMELTLQHMNDWLAASMADAPVNAAVADIGSYETLASFAKKLKAVKWLWDGWLAAGTVTMLASAPGTGKSLLALRIADCILSGAPWPDGSPVPSGDVSSAGQRFVLWIEAENGEAFHAHRCSQMGIDPSRIILPTPIGGDVTPDLNDDAFRETIASIARDERVRLIVVDSLSAANRGRDENSSSSADAVQWLSQLARATGKAVLLVHHQNKIGWGASPSLASVRGSGALVQHCRNVWVLDAPNSAAPEHLRLSCVKSNHGQKPTAIGLEILPGGFLNAAPVPTPSSPNGERDSRIVALHKQGLPQRQISEQLDIGLGTVNRAISMFQRSNA